MEISLLLQATKTISSVWIVKQIVDDNNQLKEEVKEIEMILTSITQTIERLSTNKDASERVQNTVRQVIPVLEDIEQELGRINGPSKGVKEFAVKFYPKFSLERIRRKRELLMGLLSVLNMECNVFIMEQMRPKYPILPSLDYSTSILPNSNWAPVLLVLILLLCSLTLIPFLR